MMATTTTLLSIATVHFLRHSLRVMYTMFLVIVLLNLTATASMKGLSMTLSTITDNTVIADTTANPEVASTPDTEVKASTNASGPPQGNAAGLLPGLSQKHVDLLHSSAISNAVIQARGYRTVTDKAELKKLGFSNTQLLVPSLVIPLYDLNGQVVLHQIRPDKPRIREAEAAKYELPAGKKKVIDVPPVVQKGVLNATVPLYVTEGMRKADAAASKNLCCIGLIDVYGWMRQDNFWSAVPLAGRSVYITFDSDIVTNRSVKCAAAKFAAFLSERGAGPGSSSCHRDRKGQRSGSMTTSKPGTPCKTWLPSPGPNPRSRPLSSPGRSTRQCTRAGPRACSRRRSRARRIVWKKLANFHARIISDVQVTDGIEEERQCEIEAKLKAAATALF